MVYYERRQRLAPITGPAPKPRVRNGAKRPLFFSPVIFPALAHVMTWLVTLPMWSTVYLGFLKVGLSLRFPFLLSQFYSISLVSLSTVSRGGRIRIPT